MKGTVLFHHCGIIKAYCIIHSALPGSGNPCAIGRTVFAQPVAVVVPVFVPPMMKIKNAKFGFTVLNIFAKKQ
jgi:hypothetical protein